MRRLMAAAKTQAAKMRVDVYGVERGAEAQHAQGCSSAGSRGTLGNGNKGGARKEERALQGEAARALDEKWKQRRPRKQHHAKPRREASAHVMNGRSARPRSVCERGHEKRGLRSGGAARTRRS